MGNIFKKKSLKGQIVELEDGILYEKPCECNFKVPFYTESYIHGKKIPRYYCKFCNEEFIIKKIKTKRKSKNKENKKVITNLDIARFLFKIYINNFVLKER